MIFLNMKRSYILLILLILTASITFAAGDTGKYLEVLPKNGDGIQTLLKRYRLPINSETMEFFKSMNSSKLTKNGGMLLHHEYTLPIKIYEFDGKTIRSTIDNPDWDNAKSIEVFNDRLFTLGIKPRNFRDDKELWVPLEKGIDFTSDEFKTETNVYPIFGKKYENIELIDNSLENRVFYIVSGHGGPDPGAIGYKNNHELHEEEYAYDVALRLARRLIEHRAIVYIIVQDDNDGIRDAIYLNNSSDEYYYGGHEISSNQLERLRKRVDIINELYDKHASSAVSQQAIILHVDSRVTNQRIDIFFYYSPGSEAGKRLNSILLDTIERKYRAAQPGRGYKGSISSRNLYVLRHAKPVCAFIELGNIQNPLDQDRILIVNNRQAIANWLTDGVIKAAQTEN